jgi:hypothetical protein
MLSLELFREVRPEFLRLLGSPAARVYVDVADALDVESMLRSGALPREEAIAIAERVVEQHAEVDIEEASGLEIRERARLVIERLLAARWLQPEDRANYQRFILVEPNAAIVLEALRKIARPGAAVFSDKLVAACNALRNRQALANEPWQTVEACLEDTQHGVQELRAVAKSIERHTRRQLGAQSLRENLEVVFDQYATQVGHTAYAELVRSRLPTRLPEARVQVEALQNDAELLFRMQEEVLRRENGLDPGTAMARVQQRLDELAQALDRVVPSADDVDRRTAEFARKSLARFRYLQEVTGEHRRVVQRFFEILNALVAGRTMADAELRLEDLPGLLMIDVKLLAGLESLYRPRLRASMGEVEPLYDEPTGEELENSRQELAATLRDSLTITRANRFANEAFKRFGKRVQSSQLLRTDDDLDDLIACLLHAQSREARYRVEAERDLENPDADHRKHDRVLAGTCRVERFTLCEK